MDDESTGWGRRDFLKLGAHAGGVLGFGGASSFAGGTKDAVEETSLGSTSANFRPFNGPYRGPNLDHIAFPLGGMGAGMICLEGAGGLSKVSFRNPPTLVSDPIIFAALSVRKPQQIVRILEGPVPSPKVHSLFPQCYGQSSGVTFGLPRLREATFNSRFPFATVLLRDSDIPFDVEVMGWSPFLPGDADNSSLPVAGLEYRIVNRSAEVLEATFSFNSENFMATPPDSALNSWATSLDRIYSTDGGFLLSGIGTKSLPWDKGHCAVWVDDPGVEVDHAWFGEGLGLAFDSVAMLWNNLHPTNCCTNRSSSETSSPGASIFVPFELRPGQAKTIVVYLAWYIPASNVFAPTFAYRDGQFAWITKAAETYKPWYTERFKGVHDLKQYWQRQYSSLKELSGRFSQAFYDCSLPPEIIEAVAANLTILKSPTVLRQTDGRLWAWEGTGDKGGYGSCTHVWNYAQALPHLFPELERGLRETEFGPDQGTDGHQAFRSALPIRAIGNTSEGHIEPPAADGQLGGIIKAYREWRVSGNTTWLRALWTKILRSLDYCIEAWDPTRRGSIDEAHTNTYDIVFWGADSLCTGLYLGALKAATLMGTALGEDVDHYSRILARGVRRMQQELFNGEYFIQKVEWRNLRTPFPPERGPLTETFPPMRARGLELAHQEGPPYQYGEGCLSDGVFGAWLSLVSGLDDVLDRAKIESHLNAVYRYNLRTDLSAYPKVGRQTLASGTEAGLLLCTWPRSGRPSLPMIYSDEVWTGTEYQVASHLIAFGRIEEGLQIVRAVRQRYDGRSRNPFSEVEAAQWYARAMSSYALLQAFSGARFDAVDKVLHLKPVVKGDFRCFLSTATGFGTVGVKDGFPFVEVVSGHIPYAQIRYVAA